MQTANGIVELTNEITFDIEKLKQSTTAVVGKDTPDLLSVGYRCQELGYGFLLATSFDVLFCFARLQDRSRFGSGSVCSLFA